VSERRGEERAHGQTVGEAEDGTGRVCESARARVCTPVGVG